MLILILVGLGLTIAGFWVAIMRDDWLCGIGLIVGCISFVVFIMIGLSWPLVYYDWQEFKAEYEATDKMIADYNKSGGSIGDAGLIVKVVELNQSLARWQLYNGYWLSGMFVPDDVDNYTLLVMN